MPVSKLFSWNVFISTTLFKRCVMRENLTNGVWASTVLSSINGSMLLMSQLLVGRFHACQMMAGAMIFSIFSWMTTSNVHWFLPNALLTVKDDGSSSVSDVISHVSHSTNATDHSALAATCTSSNTIFNPGSGSDGKCKLDCWKVVGTFVGIHSKTTPSNMLYPKSGRMWSFPFASKRMISVQLMQL